jgi:hypothetical protein
MEEKMKRYVALSLVLCFLVACRGEVAPTLDVEALRKQVKQEVLAELTASAPTATPTLLATAAPTKTQAATQTATSAPTQTLVPTQTVTPASTATRTATATPSELPPTSTATESPEPTEPVRATKVAKSPDVAASPTPAPPTRTPTAFPPEALAGTIAFAAYEPAVGGYTLYTFAGGALHVVANHVHQPDIRPDGLEIAVDGAGAGKEDLWAVGIHGGNWRQLTHHPDDHYPTWSATGMEVAFSSTRHGDGVHRLYLGDELIGTYKTPFIMGDYPILLWSGDIVFAGCDYGWGIDNRCGLWLASEGGVPTRLTDNSRDVPTDANPSDVLFLRQDGDNWDIYRIGSAGGDPVRLTNTPGRDGPAALSPDGKAIAFLSDRSGAWALYTANLMGGQVRKVLDLPLGVNFDQAPCSWWSERISWGSGPMYPTPAPTRLGGPLLPAPIISFPIPDDTVSSTRPTGIVWSWSQALGPNQGFEVRFWHTSETTPAGAAAPTADTHLEVSLGLTDAYRWHGEGFYYLDVVVVQLDPYRVLSESAPVRVKTDANK